MSDVARSVHGGYKRLRRYLGRYKRLRFALCLWRHRSVRPTDVFLASYPRSGNTWLKFMVCELLTGMDADFDTSEQFVPSVGSHLNSPGILPAGGRLIKAHEKYSTALHRSVHTAIYIVRDSRDVAVSEYYYQRRLGLYEGDFPTFCRLFVDGKVSPYGPWHENVRSWVNSGIENLLIVKYEDLLADTHESLREVARFLKMPIPDDETLDGIVRHNSAEAMRAKEEGSAAMVAKRVEAIPFVRSAQSGGWRAEFSPHNYERFMDQTGPTMESIGYPVS